MESMPKTDSLCSKLRLLLMVLGKMDVQAKLEIFP